MSFDLPGVTSALGAAVDPAPRAPRLPAIGMAVAAVLAAIACVASFVVEGSATVVALAVVGYVLGAVVVIALGSVQRAATSRARQHPEFRPELVWARLAVVAMVVGLLSGAASAFALATELAK